QARMVLQQGEGYGPRIHSKLLGLETLGTALQRQIALGTPHSINGAPERISGGPILQPMPLPLHGTREAACQGSKVAVVESEDRLGILWRHRAEAHCTGRLRQQRGTINVLHGDIKDVVIAVAVVEFGDTIK